MALKRGKSSGLDWQDVTQAAVNMQGMVGGEITLTLKPTKVGSSWDLLIVAVWEFRSTDPAAPIKSASASVSCRARRYNQLEGACLSALHAVDVALYAADLPPEGYH